jgi:type I restriction enzyme S subunit
MAAEWQVNSLAELIDVKHGYAFNGEFIHDEPRGDILLTPGNFAIGGGFKGDKFKYYDGPVPKEFVLQKGELLVTMTDLSKQADTLGYPAFVPACEHGRRYLHNQRLGKVLIKAQQELDTRFLHYLLRSAAYRHEVLASATGTTVKHTSPERIKQFRFNRPPLAEQRAIAHILGTLDDRIELNRRINETLEAMARTLFRSWFVDFDPVRAKATGRDPGLPKPLADLFPASFVDSDLGKIPEGWDVASVDDEFELVMGQSPPGDTYNEIGEGLPFYQGRADFDSRFPKRRVYCTAPTRLAKAGNTLISVRAPVGDINMARETCGIGRGVAAAIHKSGSRSFTYQFMRGLHTAFVQFEAEGTVFGSITKKDFHAIPCVAPPRNAIAVFEKVVSPVDDRIETATLESRSLAFLRDFLLPKLISGELRVGDAERFTGRVR